METKRKPQRGKSPERHNLTAPFYSTFDQYAANGHAASFTNDEGFIDFIASCIPHDGTRILFDEGVLRKFRVWRTEKPILFRKAASQFRKIPGVHWPDIEAAIEAIPSELANVPKPQSGTALLAKEFADPTYFVSHMLPQGLALLAGKSKRGKTYLCLDIGMSISFGRKAFRQLDTHQSKVLFVSLEDGEVLVQKNLRKIQPNLMTLEQMDFVYECPRLGDGALEAMKHWLADYPVIFLDILGRILPDSSRMRKNVSEYQVITDFLGPLHDITRDRECLIVLLDHLRKAPSEDEFDEIMGSMAKVGVVDTAMLYKRNDNEVEATISLRSKWYGDNKIVVTLVDGHLEFVGEGEQYQADTEERRIIKVLEEEERPMQTAQIVQALGLTSTQYHRLRMRLTRMFNEGTISRIKGKGLWTLGGGGGSDVPF